MGVAPAGGPPSTRLPPRIPWPKTRWNSADFSGQQKEPSAQELADRCGLWQRSVDIGGGEGGIARGRGRPLVLRFAPDRRFRVVPNRSAIWSNPGGFVHTPCTC